MKAPKRTAERETSNTRRTPRAARTGLLRAQAEKRSKGAARGEEDASTASASRAIDARIAELGGWRGETLARMRALIRAVDPAIVEEVKWGGTPVWSCAGIVCTGESYAKVVKLTFAHGAALDDPARLFNASLEGKTRRAIDLREGERVDARAFQALVKAAIAHNVASKSGSTAEKRDHGAKAPAGTKAEKPRTPSKAAKAVRAAQPASNSRATKPASTTSDGAPASAAKRGSTPRAATKVRLLSGGNPQIAKGDGDAPVAEYVAALDGWKQDVVRRIDALVVRTVPGVQKAVKWNSPFYGVEGAGWFLSFHVFTKYVKVTFFRGTALRPPPAGGTAKDARWIDVHEDDFDEAQMKDWIRQAAALPGWMA